MRKIESSQNPGLYCTPSTVAGGHGGEEAAHEEEGAELHYGRGEVLFWILGANVSQFPRRKWKLIRSWTEEDAKRVSMC